MIVIIDNYDSFTYNIVQAIGALLLEYGQSPDKEMKVFRNDAITVQEIALLSPDRLLISPGPCSPPKAGISIEAISFFSTRIPVLGVCLGHQALNEAFGGRTVHADRVMHGKTSPVRHDNRGVFTGLPNPFDAMRYHSLVAERSTLPACLAISATTDRDEIMGLRHKTLPVEGVQFHPESIMTPDGVALFRNFLAADYESLLR